LFYCCAVVAVNTVQKERKENIFEENCKRDKSKKVKVPLLQLRTLATTEICIVLLDDFRYYTIYWMKN